VLNEIKLKVRKLFKKSKQSRRAARESALVIMKDLTCDTTFARTIADSAFKSVLVLCALLDVCVRKKARKNKKK